MRSYICVRHENNLYKLVWTNEDRKGVYVGWYGEVAGTHSSYHTDGIKHFRLSTSPEAINQHKGLPIQDIDSFVQVGYQTIPLYSRMMGIIGHEYLKEDSHSAQAFFINGSLFGQDRIDLDLYLLHREKEQEFVRFIFTSRADKINLCAINSLDHFPNHKVAMVILQPNEEEERHL
jgi:hypothetical protein